MNVQRLENEEFLPILSPRAPSNLVGIDIKTYMEKPRPDQRSISNSLKLRAISNSLKLRKQLEFYKKGLVLHPDLFEIAVGTLLGDASLQTQDGGKTFRLKFSQADKLHREYLFHLHQQFAQWVLSPPSYHPGRKMWSFQTISHVEFRPLAEMFVLKDGILCGKYINPALLETRLTPRGLAYWIMDDGGRACYNLDSPRRGVVLNTHGFSKGDVVDLCGILTTRFGLHCWTRLNKGRDVIVISGTSFDILDRWIRPYLVPSMWHKLPISKLMT